MANGQGEVITIDSEAIMNFFTWPNFRNFKFVDWKDWDKRPSMELHRIRWIATPPHLILNEAENGNWICYHFTDDDTVICLDQRGAGLLPGKTIIFPFGAAVTEMPVLDAYAWEEQSILKIYKKRIERIEGPVYKALNFLDPYMLTEENDNPQDPLGYDFGHDFVRGRADVLIGFVETRLGMALDEETRSNFRQDVDDIWYGR